jgi:hypothetical protein
MFGNFSTGFRQEAILRDAAETREILGVIFMTGQRDCDCGILSLIREKGVSIGKK